MSDADLRSEIAWLRAQVEAERARNLELTARLMELQRDGFHPPAPEAPAPAGDEPLRAVRVLGVAGTETRVPGASVAAQAGRWAAQVIGEVGPEKVAEMIWDGLPLGS